MGISLWLVPPDETAGKLKRIMDNPAYPSFHPHITLASFPSDTPTPALRAALLPALAPIPVKFKRVVVGDAFFRSVLVDIDLSDAFADLHAHIHNTLEPHTPRYPHLSIYYILDGDNAKQERERALQQLSDTKRVIQDDEKVGTVLDCRSGLEQGSSSEDRIDGFVGCAVWIAQCDGPVESWSIIDKIPLGS